MTIRPLYLEGGQRVVVRLDDGVALRVQRDQRARSLYPLRRLSRVISGCGVEWSTEALVACLHAGVPVVFRDGRGQTVGWCFGKRRRETTLGELLRLGVGEADWDLRFGAWAAAVHRREIREALRCAGAGDAAAELRRSRTRLCNAHRDRLGAPCGELLRALTAAVSGLVAETLQREIGDPELIGFARPGLHLGSEFAGLLEWRLHRILLSMPTASVSVSEPGRFAAHCVEHHGTMLQRTLSGILGDLEIALRNWLL
jgi:hypothetical protein